MLILTGIALIIIFLSLMPKIKKWVLHHRCPYCRSWTRLKFRNFEEEYIVTGHDQGGLFTGLFKSLRILGLFGGINFYKDHPFLRIFGTGYYVCPKCNHEVMLEEHRDKR